MPNLENCQLKEALRATGRRPCVSAAAACSLQRQERRGLPWNRGTTPSKQHFKWRFKEKRTSYLCMGVLFAQLYTWVCACEHGTTNEINYSYLNDWFWPKKNLQRFFFFNLLLIRNWIDFQHLWEIIHLLWFDWEFCFWTNYNEGAMVNEAKEEPLKLRRHIKAL